MVVAMDDLSLSWFYKYSIPSFPEDVKADSR